MNEQYKLLIVDDEPSLLGLIKDIVVFSDILPEANVFLAANGQEGFEIAQRESPQVVVTDMMMPIMNGAELIEKMSHCAAVPISIVMSGYADFDMAVSLFAHNVFNILRKPFKHQEIAAAIKSAFAKIELEQSNQSYQKRLMQADKLSAIGLLAAGIAHEINNSNTYIKGNLELLEKSVQMVKSNIQSITLPEEKQHKINAVIESLGGIVQSAVKGSEHIKTIVSSVLNYSRSGGLPGKTNARLVIDQALTLSAFRHKKHKKIVTISDTLSDVFVDKQELVQVLMNLLVNASDSMDEKQPESGGVLEVSAYDDQENKHQIIKVKDNGLGISPEKITKIFDAFYTTKSPEKGTGLGLYLCRKMIENNHGTITCESAEGQGALFIIEFPIQNEGSAAV